ncbi:hypothetical protein [Pseudomonas sp.]|uniref:hypothetical protein n=1 Tax=Pseudomonas sp. TaxID=306 RepID=UPI003FD88D48
MDNIHTWRQVKDEGYGAARLDSVKRSKVLSLRPVQHWYYRYWYCYQLDCGHTLEGCRSVKRRGFYSPPKTVSCPVCGLVAIREFSFDMAFKIWLDHEVSAAKEEIEELATAELTNRADGKI